MEKEKKKLNIEKPKTLKTSQNDKSFLKKRRKQLTLPGLWMVWLDLDHKQKFVEKKKQNLENWDYKIWMHSSVLCHFTVSVLRISAMFRKVVAEHFERWFVL